MKATILIGDALAELARLPDASVHCCITSPPYFQLRAYQSPPQVWGGDPECRHMWRHQVRYTEKSAGKVGAEAFSVAGEANAAGLKEARWREDHTCTRCGAWKGELGLEPTVELYLAHMVAVFREVRRVLRDDGTLWLNLGDGYDAGTRSTRDCSHGTKHGYWNNPAINQRPKAGLKPKDLIMMPHRLALALQQDGWWVRSDIVWAKNNPMPESVTDRPTRTHEYLFLLSKQPRYFYDAYAIRENGVCAAGTKGAKGSVERSNTARVNSRPPEYKIYDGYRNARSVWRINSAPYKGVHFATFPPALVRPCIRAGTSAYGCCGACGAPWMRVTKKGEQCPEPAHRQPTKRLEPGQAGNIGAGNMGFRASRLSGQEMAKWRQGHPDRDSGWTPTCTCFPPTVEPCTVLDPFAGSGTTGEVALAEGRRAILIELNPEYEKLITARLEAVQLPLCLEERKER